MKRTPREYHSGNRDLMGKRLTQVTGLAYSVEAIAFAVRQLEKYGTPWIILKTNGHCALFREKT